jgi:hypothetical protein
MPPDPPPPPLKATDQRTFQRRGALVAIGVAAVFLALILFYTLGPRPAPPQPAPENPGDIVIRPGDSRPGGDRMRIDLVDKKDPTRKTGLLILDLDPDPNQNFYFNVTKPEAFLYLADGSTGYIRADRGRFYMPDERNAPESGSLTGHVVAQVFPARPDGKPADPATDTPIRTLITNSLQFDSALVEASTEDPFEYTQPGLRISDAVGFHLYANQVHERIEKFVTEHGGRIHLTQLPEATKKPGRPGPAHAAAPGAARANTAPAPSPAPLSETLYHMTFENTVAFRSGDRAGDADRLELWARFINNKLPENAITQIKTLRSARPREAAAPGAATAAPRPQTAAAPRARGDQPAPASSPAEQPQDMTMTWKGPCTILPLDTVPPELKDDHVAVRLSAAPGRQVVFREEGRLARAAAVDYGLTTTRLVLDTPAQPTFDRAAASLLTDQDAQSAAAWHIEHVFKSGLTHISGPGEITGPQGHIPWTDQADFQFFLGPQGEVTSALKQATFAGNVNAAAKEGHASGSFLRADFVLLPIAPGTDPASALTRLQLHDGGAESEQSGRIAGTLIDVAFKPSGKGSASDPVSLMARGAVHVEREQALDADELDADLAQNPLGKTDITRIEARGSVRYADPGQAISAAADTLRADLSWDPALAAPLGSDGAGGRAGFPRKQLVDLISTAGDSRITKQDGPVTSAILSRQMRLDGVARALNAFGPGSFSRADPASKDGPSDMLATWTQSMSFNDATGRIECTGDATAVFHPDPMTLQTARGESIYINITPAAAVRDPAVASAPARAGAPRELLRAEAVGTILTREGGTPASVEMRRYLAARDPTPQEQDRPLGELYYLEGARILADNAAQTVDVPGAGKLLLVDQRPEPTRPAERPEADRANPFAGSSDRGTSLFDWAASMHMDRVSGSIQLRRTVHLTHKNLDTPAQVTNLTCEMLVAKIRELNASGATAAKAELVSATATGAVYLTAGPERTAGEPRPPRREMIADTLEYDAIHRTVDARAAEGNSVMVYDPKQPTPASARRILWNLSTDRIEIKQPGAFVAPAPNSR